MKIAENNCAPVEQCVSRSTLATVSATPKNLAPLDKSNLIKDLQQLSREHAARCAAIARKAFQRAILPIYGESRNRLTHIGTCTLLEIDGVKLFVTAAHVIDNHRQSVLYTDGAGKIMPISGDFKSTNAPGGKRSLDHYDFSVCPLTPEFAAQLGDVTYIGNSSISAGRRASDDPSAYLTMGYPNSRNKNIDMAAGIVNVRLWNFTSFAKPNREMSDPWERASPDHLFLQFDQKHAGRPDGKRENAINPVGASGGPVFYVGNFNEPNHYSPNSQIRPLLEGILIEKSPSSRALVAVRIGVAIEMMRMSRILPRRS